MSDLKERIMALVKSYSDVMSDVQDIKLGNIFNIIDSQDDEIERLKKDVQVQTGQNEGKNDIITDLTAKLKKATEALKEIDTLIKDGNNNLYEQAMPIIRIVYETLAEINENNNETKEGTE